MQSAPKTDEFLSASPEPLIVRGRYRLVHPVTGKTTSWTRATNFARSITDEFGLLQWKERMVARGMAMRPDLVAAASALEVTRENSSRLNALVEQAKNAAGAKASANLGTALHKFTEDMDQGGSLDDVPPAQRADVAAYVDGMKSAGVTAVPGMVERITVIPEHGVAGKFDRILRMPDGPRVIGDVKTGKNLDYDWLSISIQLALYALGVNTSGVFDESTGTWQPVPRVSTEYGIVMHVPAGTATCTLYRVDLVKGMEYLDLCVAVRAARKDRDLSSVWEAPNAQSPFLDPLRGGVGVIESSVTWETRFSSVATRAEASALFRDAAADPAIDAAELSRLVSLAKRALGMN